MSTTPDRTEPNTRHGGATRVWRGPRGLIRCLAIATAIAIAPGAIHAQSNSDGAIVGEVADVAATVVVESQATGAKHTAKVGSSGGFRVGSLPPGRYNVTMTKPGAVPVVREVNVVVGATTGVAFDDVEVLEALTVSESPITPIDFGKVESVTILTEAQFDALPIARNTTAIALLSPGTTRGDTAFGDDGNLVSFGGASVSENGYYLNGMNISNFRNGLDPALIPFEAYSQFETLTGAYSAQYGRSTGGVINATTKSGTNEFHAGVNISFQPESLTANRPSSYYNNGGTVTPHVYNKADVEETLDANVYVSGPIWKDKIFFYGLYNARRIEDDDAFATLGTIDKTISDDPFWLVKLDVLPIANHHLEYTGFQDERTKTITTYSNYDFTNDTHDPDGALGWEFRGGTTHVGRYTGVFTDNFTFSALYGHSEQDRRTLTESDSEPLVLERRSGLPQAQLAGNTSATGVIDSQSLDTREALRFDLEYRFPLAGEHRLRAGYDQEDNETIGQSAYADPPETGYWRYSRVAAGGTVNGVVQPTAADVARFRVLDSGGSFQVKSKAYYVEDNWSLSENRLLLRLGIRNEEFENLNAIGETFIHVKNQWAPRLGFSYDLFGDRKTKIFANFGRYHLPVASNTNLRLGGAETFTEDWYYLNGIEADGYSPILGAKIGDQTVLSDGEVKDTRTIVDTTIKPMYQDEWVVGVQREVSKNLTVGVRGIVRDMATAMDDMIVDHALVSWGVRNGKGTQGDLEDEILGSFHYVLGNPGKEMTTAWDYGTGLETVQLTTEDLGYPSASRKYYSFELFTEKVYDGKWGAQFSYTWAHSYGNSEGWVLSDNGQDDAGITIMFDTPMLTDGSYGNLANDVRHQFKFFGSYSPARDFLVGVNSYLKSGRPINQFVNVDEPVIGLAYGNDYFGVKRGSAGNTAWVFNLDLSLRWAPTNLGFLGDNFSAQIDIFNVLNEQAPTEVYEGFEEDQLLGTPDARYGIPTSWQSPRSVRFSMSYDF